MTWYWGDREVGDAWYAAMWLYDMAMGDEWATEAQRDAVRSAFEAHIEETWTPVALLGYLTETGDDYGDMLWDWLVESTEGSRAFCERYGFEWRDEE